jgi:hypothetical protein
MNVSECQYYNICIYTYIIMEILGVSSITHYVYIIEHDHWF